MKPIKILSLLFLLPFLSYRSFALDADQDSISNDSHVVTIQEYCQCLTAMASAEDLHGLYNPETMSGEILQRVSVGNDEPHLLYGIVHGVDPQSPMQGLSELDAMRCCNWMETSLPTHDTVTLSTEVGSYILHEDGSFEINDQAQLHLLSRDDGTFEIVSKVVQKISSPLMMYKPGGADPTKKTDFRFPQIGDTGSQTTANRRAAAEAPRAGSRLTASQENPTVSGMNLTLRSLAPILHNDNFDDDSLIGHTPHAASDGNYVAIKNYSWCLPDVIKACLTPEETRQQIQAARQQVRAALRTAMLESDAYKEQTKGGVTRQLLPTQKLNQEKINKDLQKFDQFFTDHNFTRGKLEQFCLQHHITVPAPATGRIPKVSEDAGPSIYGSLERIGDAIVTGLQQGKNRLPGQYTSEDIEYEQVPTTERTPLAATPATAAPAAARAVQQPLVFNETHVKEIHDLIVKTKQELPKGSTLKDAYDLFDRKAELQSSLSPKAQALLDRIKRTSDPEGAQKRQNWVYQSLDPNVPLKNITSLKNAVAHVEANLSQAREVANRSETLVGNAQEYNRMVDQLRQQQEQRMW